MRAKAALAVLALALGAGVQAQHRHHHGSQPPPPRQGVFSVDVFRDGGILHLLTGEGRGEETSLWHRRSADGGVAWSAPVRVDGGRPPRLTQRGDDAQVAARGATVLAVWSVPGTGYGGSGPFASALSRDGGATWTSGGNPSDSGTTRGHGFTDLAADAQGFHAVWLDSRTKQQALYYSRSADGLKWAANANIVPTTCECCWNSLLSGGAGGELLVMYRAKDPRDMEIAALTADGWRPRGVVAPFDWRIKGCPETGGGLVAAGGALHALVWTGVDRRTGLYAVKADAARTGSALRWGSPRQLGGEGAQHGDLAAGGSRLAAVWDDGGAIYYAGSDDAGGKWSAPRRLAAQDSRATNPRVAPAGNGFLVWWTQQGADERWTLQTARVP